MSSPILGPDADRSSSSSGQGSFSWPSTPTPTPMATPTVQCRASLTSTAPTASGSAASAASASSCAESESLPDSEAMRIPKEPVMTGIQLLDNGDLFSKLQGKRVVLVQGSQEKSICDLITKAGDALGETESKVSTYPVGLCMRESWTGAARAFSSVDVSEFGLEYVFLNLTKFVDVRADMSLSLSWLLAHSLLKCDSTRFLVVVSCREMASNLLSWERALSNLVPIAANWPEWRESFAFLFTDLEPSLRGSLVAKLEEAKRRRGDPKQVLQWLIDCLKEGKNQFADILHQDSDLQLLWERILRNKPMPGVQAGGRLAGLCDVVSKDSQRRISESLVNMDKFVTFHMRGSELKVPPDEMNALAAVCEVFAGAFPEIIPEVAAKIIGTIRGRAADLLTSANNAVALSYSSLTVEAAAGALRDALAAQTLMAMPLSRIDPAGGTRVPTQAFQLACQLRPFKSKLTSSPLFHSSKLLHPVTVWDALGHLVIWFKAGQGVHGSGQAYDLPNDLIPAVDGVQLLRKYSSNLVKRAAEERKRLPPTLKPEDCQQLIQTLARLLDLGRCLQKLAEEKGIMQVIDVDILGKATELEGHTLELVQGILNELRRLLKTLSESIRGYMDGAARSAPIDVSVPLAGSAQDDPIQALVRPASLASTLAEFSSQEAALVNVRDTLAAGLQALEQDAQSLGTFLESLGTAALEATPPDGPFGDSVHEVLRILETLVSIFDERIEAFGVLLRRPFQEALDSHQSGMDTIANRWLAQLEGLDDQGMSVSEWARLQNILNSVMKSNYDKDRSCLAKFVAHARTSLDQAKSLLQVFLESPLPSSHQEGATKALAMQTGLEGFVQLDQEFEAMVNSLNTCVRDLLACWKSRHPAPPLAPGLLTLLLDESSRTALDLEEVFIVCRVFDLLTDDEMAEKFSQASDCVQRINEEVEDLMGSRDISKGAERFPTMRRLFELLSDGRLLNLQQKLRPLEELRGEVNEELRGHCTTGQTMIQEKRFTAALHLKNRLQEAQPLDSYLESDVKDKLVAMTSSISEERLQFRHLVDACIQKFDFADAVPRLLEMASSELEDNQPFLEDTAQRISNALKEQESRAMEHAGDAEMSRIQLKKLEKAKTDLQTVQKIFHDIPEGVDLAKVGEALKQNLSKILGGFTAKLANCQADEPLEACECEQQLLAYYAPIQDWLPPSTVKAARDAQQGVKSACCSELNSLLKGFLKALSSDSQTWQDAGAGELVAQLVARLDDFEKLPDRGGSSTSVNPVQEGQTSGGWIGQLTSLFRKPAASAGVLETGVSATTLPPIFCRSEYTKSVSHLSSQLKSICQKYLASSSYPSDMGVIVKAPKLFQFLAQQSEAGLERHLDEGCGINFQAELEAAARALTDRYAGFSDAETPIQQMSLLYIELLNRWLTSSRTDSVQEAAYQSDQQQAHCCLEELDRGASELLSQDNHPACWVLSQAMMDLERSLNKHRGNRGSTRSEDLRASVSSHLQCKIDETVCAVRAGGASLAQAHLFNIRQMVTHLRGLLPDPKQCLQTLATDLAKLFGEWDTSFTKCRASYHFPVVGSTGKALLTSGPVLLDALALFAEQRGAQTHAERELTKVRERYFPGSTLDFNEFQALLGTSPASGLQEIEAAYNRRIEEERVNASTHVLADMDSPNGVFLEAMMMLQDQGIREQYMKDLRASIVQMVLDIQSEMQEKLTSKLAMEGSRDRDALNDLLRPASEWRGLMEELQIENGPDLEAELKSSVHEHFCQLLTSANSAWDERQLDQLNTTLVRLRKGEETFKVVAGTFPEAVLRDLQEKVEGHIVSTKNDLEAAVRTYPEDQDERVLGMRVAKWLLEVGRIGYSVSEFQDFAVTQMESQMVLCKENRGVTFTLEIGKFLLGKDAEGRSPFEKNDDKNVAAQLLQKLEAFTVIQAMIRMQETSASDRDVPGTIAGVTSFVLDADGNMTETPVDRSTLKTGIVLYLEAMSQLFARIHDGELDQPGLVSMMEEKLADAGPCSLEEWTLRDIIPELLAILSVFVKFSPKWSGQFRSALAAQGNTRPNPEDLPGPHLIQILTLLQMFGYDTDSPTVKSKLAEVRTGEGKSIILGMASILWARMGFEVYCISHSKFLSERDLADFADMFHEFGLRRNPQGSGDSEAAPGAGSQDEEASDQIADMIFYTDISDYRERLFKAKGDLRELVGQLLTGRPLSGRAPDDGRRRPRILLLDEVDMAFSDKFYGKTTRIVRAFKRPEVVELFQFLWRLKSTETARTLFEKARLSTEYARVEELFPGFEYVVEAELKKMCSNIHHVDTPPLYTALHDSNRIGYQEFDRVNTKTSYGYKTAFAYLKESENFADRQAAFDYGLSISLPCGMMAYSSIQGSFDRVFGVSGSLSALTSSELQIMHEYGIREINKMPSMYGWGKFEKDEPAVLDTRQQHFGKILEVGRRMISENRACLVVFADGMVLEEFAELLHSEGVTTKVNKLKEDLRDAEKARLIISAATCGTWTLTTEAFGRGMNFVSNDEELTEAGGLHVIQAFFSSSKSEEIQVEGRTARQNRPGSYSLILCMDDLREQFKEHKGLPWSSLPKFMHPTDPNEIYKRLHEKRLEVQKEGFKKKRQHLEDVRNHELNTNAFLDLLCEGNRETCCQFYEEKIQKM